MNRRDKGLNYLKQYPKLDKWINRCICCGRIGYNPSLPENFTSNWGQGEYEKAGAQNFRDKFIHEKFSLADIEHLKKEVLF